MERKRGKWIRVSRSEPCPVCERPDYCTRSEDGAVVRCTRVESAKESKGADGSIAWVHRLSEPLPKAAPKAAPPRVCKAEWAIRARQMFSVSEAPERREQLSNLLGVSVLALEELQVGVGYDQWNGAWFWSFPERDAQWRPVGIKRRYTDGAQKHMQGAMPGLYMAREWWVNPGPVFLPEGGSDVAALLTMGLCAVGRSSNTGSVEMLIGLLRDCEHKPIVVLGENDRKPEKVGVEVTASKTADGKHLCPRNCAGCAWCFPGKFGAVVTAQRLSLALKRTVHYRMIADAKDAREWLNKFGIAPYEFVKSLKVPAAWLKSVEVLKC